MLALKELQASVQEVSGPSIKCSSESFLINQFYVQVIFTIYVTIFLADRQLLNYVLLFSRCLCVQRGSMVIYVYDENTHF